ncbi:hypothetical protein [Pseudomonas sp. DSV-1]|uniref:hypothetical protein n=1 Tax=Pseudomonas sp. DSV-1 TaxID=3112250 RepID=UPI002DBC9C4E|nr:hypothetical protein [Pseudomonas sp. DSV-1]MEC4242104.1 hypothetical protein [Pseudomonas sp. DSV-1]
MEKTTPTDLRPEAASAQPMQAPSPKKGSPFVGALKWLLATKSWSNQASILKKRGSFPLLRHVLKNQVISNRIIIPTEAISDHLIAKSIIGHRIILAASSITCFYSLMLIPRGVAIGVKLDSWFNASLVLATPLLIYSGLKILMSLKVLRALNEELDSREHAQAQSTVRGGADA